MTFGGALFAAAVACGGSGKSSPTPTTTQTSEPTAQPTATPASGGTLQSDWKVYASVTYGCECAGPPAAGIVAVKAIYPLSTASNVTPLAAEVDHPSMSRPLLVSLERNEHMTDNCGGGDVGGLTGFSGSARVATDDALPYASPNTVTLPTDPPVSLRILVEDDTGQQVWLRAARTEACAAVS